MKCNFGIKEKQLFRINNREYCLLFKISVRPATGEEKVVLEVNDNTNLNECYWRAFHGDGYLNCFEHFKVACDYELKKGNIGTALYDKIMEFVELTAIQLTALSVLEGKYEWK